LPTYT